MDKHLAVRFIYVLVAFIYHNQYTEACTKIFLYSICPCLRRERTVVGRKIGYQGASLRDMLHRWRVQGQVKFRSRITSKLLTRRRMIGFEELGNIDGFDTAVLELRLSASGQLSCCIARSVLITTL